MYIHRDLEDTLRPFLKRKEVLAIVGPRQVGKTTLLQHLKEQLEKQGKSAQYITFERQNDLELFNQIEDFKELHEKYDAVFIDEFQYANRGGQKLKYLFDTTKTKYIISGSSSLELKFQTGKYMVGRMVQFVLFPLSFREYLSWKDPEIEQLLKNRVPNPFSFRPANALGSALHARLEKYFEEYLVFGGYPAVVLTRSGQEKKKILESILGNYLLREIRSLLQLATEEELMRLAKLLATQIGSLVNYQELSSTSGLSSYEVRKHLEILRQTYIIELIRPYFTNKRTELTKNPKVYFLDLGFRNFLVSDFRGLAERREGGSMVENYVFAALQREKIGFQNLSFWRTKSGAEVDFVIQKEGKIMPVEVKYGRGGAVGKSFYSFLTKFSPKLAFVLTKDEAKEVKMQQTKVIFMPVFYL